MKYLALIWSGIWRKRGRAVLLLLQIAVAFLLFGSLQGMKSGLDAAIKGLDAGVFFVRRASAMGPLPIVQMARIKALPQVVDVQPQSGLGGTYQNPKQTVGAVATDVPILIHDKASISVAAQALAAMAQTPDGTLVGRDLAKKYRWKVGDRIPLQTNEPQQDGSRVWTFQLVGIMDDPDPNDSFSNAMVINWSYFNEARANQRDTVDNYIVRVRDPKSGNDVARQIDALFVNSADETRTESLSELAQEGMRQAGDLNFIVRAIVAAVMFALLFSTAAMLMQSTRERAPEIAVLRTIGFSDGRVFMLLLFEAIVLCVVAAAMGLWLAARLLPLTRGALGGATIVMPWSVVVVGVLIALLLAAISATLPASQTLRMQIATALSERV